MSSDNTAGRCSPYELDGNWIKEYEKLKKVSEHWPCVTETSQKQFCPLYFTPESCWPRSGGLGWFGVGCSTVPVESGGLSITFAAPDEKVITEIYSKLEPFVSSHHLNKDMVLSQQRRRGAPKLIQEGTVTILKRSGYEVAFSAMQAMFPLLTDYDFQRLCCGCPNHCDPEADEAEWATSSDTEFNTNLVHVVRTKPVYSEPVMIHELVLCLAWKDYLPHADAINAALLLCSKK